MCLRIFGIFGYFWCVYVFYGIRLLYDRIPLGGLEEVFVFYFQLFLGDSWLSKSRVINKHSARGVDLCVFVCATH